jgi:ribosome-binding protein aMBF1 (putative translation factor)
VQVEILAREALCAKLMRTQKTTRKPGMELRKILAQNMRAYRRAKKVSQEKLADMCGLHRTYVGSVERSERNITIGSLSVLAKALGVSVAELLTGKPGSDER